MARKSVVEVRCSRCTRVEYRDEATEAQGPALTAVFQEQVAPGAPSGTTDIVFDDLCSPCMKTVKSHLEAIAKRIEGVSPDRKREEILREIVETETKSTRKTGS